MAHESYAPALKRIMAFAADYAVLGVYVALLTALSFALMGTDTAPPETRLDKVIAQLLAFATLTLPVILYFSLMESTGNGGTLGKRLLRIKVMRSSGGKTGLPRALMRNVLKFLPWEIAHTAIWQVPGRPFVDEMPWPNLLACVGAIICALWYMSSLFRADKRSFYDKVAGTKVVHRQG
ncbi:MAG: RDD family protein [Aquisalinus sp.]|nr:RDD family protein [Aquisalinus sp.]